METMICNSSADGDAERGNLCQSSPGLATINLKAVKTGNFYDATDMPFILGTEKLRFIELMICSMNFICQFLSKATSR